MQHLLDALEEYRKSGKAGDPNGKFTFNQFVDIVKLAMQKENGQQEAANNNEGDMSHLRGDTI